MTFLFVTKRILIQLALVLALLFVFTFKSEAQNLSSVQDLTHAKISEADQMEKYYFDRGHDLSSLRQKTDAFLKLQFQNNNLKSNFIEVLEDSQFLKSLPLQLQNVIGQVGQARFVKAVLETKYKVDKPCVNENNESVLIHSDTNAKEICFDTQKFAKNYFQGSSISKMIYPKWIVIGLLFHEHLKEFGYSDQQFELSYLFRKSIFDYSGVLIRTNILTEEKAKGRFEKQMISVYLTSAEMNDLLIKITLPEGVTCGLYKSADEVRRDQQRRRVITIDKNNDEPFKCVQSHLLFPNTLAKLNQSFLTFESKKTGQVYKKMKLEAQFEVMTQVLHSVNELGEVSLLSKAEAN